jgi:hypothetical protein
MDNIQKHICKVAIITETFSSLRICSSMLDTESFLLHVLAFLTPGKIIGLEDG